MREQYTAPTIVALGKLHELTGVDKWRGGADGVVLQPDGESLGPLSP